MSAETVLIKRMAKALQEIAELAKFGEPDSLVLLPTGEKFIEVTPEVKAALDYAASIAKEALRGVVIT